MLHDSVHYLTKAGYQELQARLDYLRQQRRPEILTYIRETVAEAGELREDAEYGDAKSKQAFVEGEIRYLEDILSNAQVLEETFPRDKNRVALGSRVTVREKGTDENEVYILVDTVEANPTEGKISSQCPLGKILLGRGVGDLVTVNAPDGKVVFEIIAIE